MGGKRWVFTLKDTFQTDILVILIDDYLRLAK